MVVDGSSAEVAQAARCSCPAAADMVDMVVRRGVSGHGDEEGGRRGGGGRACT
jgi:hypothetical protein